MCVVVNILCSSTISHYLYTIVLIVLIIFILPKIWAWFRVYKLLSKIPGPKGLPILGNALLLIGDTECKSSCMFLFDQRPGWDYIAILGKLQVYNFF